MFASNLELTAMVPPGKGKHVRGITAPNARYCGEELQGIGAMTEPGVITRTLNTWGWIRI